VTRGSGVHRGGILRHRAVRWLWSASACAAVAVWSVQIAVTVQVLEHHPVATLALVGLVGSVPALVLLPVAGISADRYDVRRSPCRPSPTTRWVVLPIGRPPCRTARREPRPQLQTFSSDRPDLNWRDFRGSIGQACGAGQHR
jgi:hypothetical protein